MTKFWEVNNAGELGVGIFAGDESGFEVRVRIDHQCDKTPYHLYRLPMYGGEPILHWAYPSIREAIEVAEGWT